MGAGIGGSGRGAPSVSSCRNLSRIDHHKKVSGGTLELLRQIEPDGFPPFRCIKVSRESGTFRNWRASEPVLRGPSEQPDLWTHTRGSVGGQQGSPIASLRSPPWPGVDFSVALSSSGAQEG
jgi:hypothetical protein